MCPCSMQPVAETIFSVRPELNSHQQFIQYKFHSHSFLSTYAIQFLFRFRFVVALCSEHFWSTMRTISFRFSVLCVLFKSFYFRESAPLCHYGYTLMSLTASMSPCIWRVLSVMMIIADSKYYLMMMIAMTMRQIDPIESSTFITSATIVDTMRRWLVLPRCLCVTAFYLPTNSSQHSIRYDWLH